MPNFKYQNRLSAAKAKSAVLRLIRMKWTPDGLASELGVTSATIYRWKAGGSDAPMKVQELLNREIEKARSHRKEKK